MPRRFGSTLPSNDQSRRALQDRQLGRLARSGRETGPNAGHDPGSPRHAEARHSQGNPQAGGDFRGRVLRGLLKTFAEQRQQVEKHRVAHAIRTDQRAQAVEGEGISSQIRPSSTRPAFFLFVPPHCLKKKATPARRHWSRMSVTHAGSMGRAPGPDSPPRMSQSIPRNSEHASAGAGDFKREGNAVRRVGRDVT